MQDHEITLISVNEGEKGEGKEIESKKRAKRNIPVDRLAMQKEGKEK